MGKARSFRLTVENEARLQDIQNILRLDNPNVALNAALAGYASYLKAKPALDALAVIMEFVTQDKNDANSRAELRRKFDAVYPGIAKDKQ